MPIEVTMPKLSPTRESGTIAQWMVKVGDTVKEGDVLADVETDKATMPMQAFDEGTVAHLDFAVGQEVGLGQRMLVLAKKGEDPKEVAESLSGGKAAQKSEPEPQRADAVEWARRPLRLATRPSTNLRPWASEGESSRALWPAKIAAESKVDIATDSR